ncbi:hypothetical protein BH11CYA1_BH11CYA1_34370 [soil metagenome]
MQFHSEHIGAILVFWVIVLLSMLALRYDFVKDGKNAGRYVFSLIYFAVGIVAAALFGFFLTAQPFELINLLSMGVFIAGPIFLIMAQAAARKNNLKMIANGLLAMALLVVAIAIDAFAIEPHWLEVTNVKLSSSKITKPIKIAVLSDLQTDCIGEYERSAVERVMQEKPDLILLPGDYIQCLTWPEQVKWQGELSKLLKEVKFAAPLGVYAVQGNVEVDGWPSIFKGLPVTTMPDSKTVYTGELAITGLSFSDSFNQSVKIAATKPYHIVMGHGPDFALAKPDADLLVAGHTHGGQVQLPLFGPPLTLAAVPRNWAQGTKEQEPVETKPGTTLILSRGVGMERCYAPRMRFLCRPQLIFIELSPKARR